MESALIGGEVPEALARGLVRTQCTRVQKERTPRPAPRRKGALRVRKQPTPRPVLRRNSALLAKSERESWTTNQTPHPQLSALNFQLSALNFQLSALNFQLSSSKSQPSLLNRHPHTLSPQPSPSHLIPHSSLLAPQIPTLQGAKEKRKKKNKGQNTQTKPGGADEVLVRRGLHGETDHAYPRAHAAQDRRDELHSAREEEDQDQRELRGCVEHARWRIAWIA
eukprot:3941593-Rhodomonas_salina.2